jgi:hypothetical protein
MLGAEPESSTTALPISLLSEIAQLVRVEIAIYKAKASHKNHFNVFEQIGLLFGCFVFCSTTLVQRQSTS